jgi:hypothetical protein
MSDGYSVTVLGVSKVTATEKSRVGSGTSLCIEGSFGSGFRLVSWVDGGSVSISFARIPKRASGLARVYYEIIQGELTIDLLEKPFNTLQYMHLIR